MKFLNWPWLPSQIFGIKSLILYGFAAGPAENLCMALGDAAYSHPRLPLIAMCISSRTRCKESALFLSDLLQQRHQVCCGGHTCLLLCDLLLLPRISTTSK